MLEVLLDFLSFSDPNVRYVTAGTVLLGISAAVVGNFTFLRKRALLGDAIAHAILPGICLAFLLTGTKNPLILLIGAVITGWLSTMYVFYLVNRLVDYDAGIERLGIIQRRLRNADGAPPVERRLRA